MLIAPTAASISLRNRALRLLRGLFLLLGTSWLLGGPAAAQPSPAADGSVDAAAVPGVYEGALAGKHTLRMELGTLAEADAAPFWGVYYYTSRGYIISLRATLTDSLTIAEHGAGLAKAPTAFFRLAPAAGGGWVGSWVTADGKSRLSVALRRLDAAAPGNCRPSISTRTYYGKYSVPVVKTADAGVTQLLRDQFSVYVATGLGPEELRAEGLNKTQQGFTSLEYEVTYQDHCLLSLALTGEWMGVNINASTNIVTVDLRTGFSLTATEQIQPAQLPAFVAECNRRLGQQVEEYIRQEGPNLMNEAPEDQAGLRSQRFTADDLGEVELGPASIAFPFEVEYEGMSSFMRKAYRRSFGPTFTPAELLPYLRPDSPLRRLAAPAPRR